MILQFFCVWSQNHHRITEWPGLKRTTMLIQFQPPCCVHVDQPPDQAAQSHIQPGLECLQGWGMHNLLGQPIPVRHHPLGEKLPPHIQPKPLLSQFKTIPPCPITIPKVITEFHSFMFWLPGLCHHCSFWTHAGSFPWHA